MATPGKIIRVREGPAIGDAIDIGPVLNTGFDLAPGHWYHVAYAYHDAADRQALYVDGVEVDSVPVGRSTGYDAKPLLPGADTQQGAPTFPLVGRIDEASIYDRALGIAEIAAIHAARVRPRNDAESAWTQSF